MSKFRFHLTADAADAADAVSVAAAVNERGGLVLLLSSIGLTECEASTSNKGFLFIQL